MGSGARVRRNCASGTLQSKAARTRVLPAGRWFLVGLHSKCGVNPTKHQVLNTRQRHNPWTLPYFRMLSSGCSRKARSKSSVLRMPLGSPLALKTGSQRADVVLEQHPGGVVQRVVLGEGQHKVGHHLVDTRSRAVRASQSGPAQPPARGWPAPGRGPRPCRPGAYL